MSRSPLALSVTSPVSSKLDRFLQRLACTRCPVLIATDFDGTLAPVVAHPEDARLGPNARAVLSRLARLPRVQLAVLTGRSLGDVSARLQGISPLWISAEHGAVLRDPQRRLYVPTSVPSDARIALLATRAQEIANLHPGALVEPKQLGVALHHRGVDPLRVQSLVDAFRLVCGALRAEWLPGRQVVEGRFADEDKGVALARILAVMPADLSYVYAGDDTTDEPALSMASLAENGLGLYVSSTERPSPRARVSGILDGPSEWLRILRHFADALEQGEGPRAS
jgi:trehalose-phosphatase